MGHSRVKWQLHLAGMAKLCQKFGEKINFASRIMGTGGNYLKKSLFAQRYDRVFLVRSFLSVRFSIYRRVTGVAMR